MLTDMFDQIPSIHTKEDIQRPWSLWYIDAFGPNPMS